MKKLASTLTLCALTLTAQNSSTRSSAGRDLNGNPIPSADVVVSGGKGATATLETTRSINGQTVPVNRIEERVVSQSSGSRVVERITREYDPTGNPGQVVRTVVEERLNKDGSPSQITSTTYRSDINGRSEVAERTLTTVQTSGSTSRTDTQIDRPNVNGTFTTQERREQVVNTTKGGQTENTVIYGRDANGSFKAIGRETATRQDTPQGTVENRSQFADNGNGMQLATQLASRTVARPDGTQQVVTDVYTTTVPGRTQDTSTPRLRERVTEDTRIVDGKVVQRTTAERADLENPGRFTRTDVLSERVCTGQCLPPQPEPEQKPADKPADAKADSKADGKAAPAKK